MPKKRLVRSSLSGSGFSVKGSHIINPRSCQPVPISEEREHVWAVAPYAALADALSTAFMVMSDDEIAAFCQDHEGVEALHLEARP
jgi:thiamine biosynthesis lipoprotein